MIIARIAGIKYDTAIYILYIYTKEYIYIYYMYISRNYDHDQHVKSKHHKAGTAMMTMMLGSKVHMVVKSG